MNERQRVLIVDDTPENIMMLREALKEDVSISAATNGEKALALALKEPQPDLILLDVMMPEIDGYEVCERLKADPATRDIPVIFVTALSETGTRPGGSPSARWTTSRSHSTQTWCARGCRISSN